MNTFKNITSTMGIALAMTTLAFSQDCAANQKDFNETQLQIEVISHHSQLFLISNSTFSQCLQPISGSAFSRVALQADCQSLSSNWTRYGNDRIQHYQSGRCLVEKGINRYYLGSCNTNASHLSNESSYIALKPMQLESVMALAVAKAKD
ncbi:hypothetical protein [Paraferrimonas sp. SM1919]|uniref:hypothetical protein n=1 Tax=Paraferrimonas sp. SM1919 TaxID=2662263 RepID=UPI0013D58BBA|nr:hypothetical protein [Paraferrimonas sp. SM1919]